MAERHESGHKVGTVWRRREGKARLWAEAADAAVEQGLRVLVAGGRLHPAYLEKQPDGTVRYTPILSEFDSGVTFSFGRSP